MSAAVVIAGIIHRYKRIFRAAKATGPSTAIVPSEHGVRNSLVFQKLVRQGILVPVGNERYYLDENREAEVQKQKQKLILVVLASIILVLLVLFVFQRK